MGFCFRETGQTRAHRSRCFERGSTCHAPKGAAARCCSFKALGRASLSGSGSSLHFFWEPAMRELQNPRLIEAVRGLADKVRRYREQYRDRGLGEENTKASLIEPVLEALGW